MKSKNQVIVILSILLFALYCSKENSEQTPSDIDIPPPDHVTIEMVSGVPFVHNASIGYSDVQLEPDLVLGDESSGIFFSTPGKVREDLYGNIFVSNSKESQIIKYSNDGQFIRTIGRQGEGPGEFVKRGLTDFCFLSDGRLIAYGNSKQRYQLFDNDGNYLDTVIRPVREFAVNSKNELYESAGLYSIENNSNEPMYYLVEKLDREFKHIHYLGKKPGLAKHVKLPKTGNGRDLNNYYIANSKRIIESDVELKTDNKDNLYILYQSKNLIEVYKADTLALMIDRELSYEYFEPHLANNTFRVPLVAYDFDVDNNGNIYVLTSNIDTRKMTTTEIVKENENNCYLEIFNRKGWLLYCIPMKNISPKKISIGQGNKIYLNDGYTYQITRYKALF
ncbi:6-bladed beta-propeller [candidate division KSB1 bacterium]